MMRLVMVEARRVWAHRATWIVLVMGLALAALTVVGARDSTEFQLSTGPSVTTTSDQYEMMLQECEAAQAAGDSGTDPSVPCEQQVGPSPDSPEGRAMAEDSQKAWERQQAEAWPGFVHGIVSGAGLGLLLMPLVIGATLVGGEYASGALGQWLTFVPRRSRVYASRLLGPVVALTLPFALAVTLLAVAVVTGTATAGGARILEATVWGPVVWACVRLVVAMLATLVGALALGFIARSTAGVLAAVLGWFVIVEGVAFSLSGRDLGQMSLLNHMSAWVSGRHTWSYFPTSCVDGCLPVPHAITWPVGGWHLTLVLLVIVATGALLFERRDVS